MTVSDMLTRSEALVNYQYRDNPEQRAAVLDMLGVYYQNTGRGGARGEKLLSEALQAVKSSRDGDLRRKLTCDHAMALENRDMVSEATRALNSVIEDPKTSPQQAAQCLQFLAYMAEQGGDFAGSLRSGRRALERLGQARGSATLRPASWAPSAMQNISTATTSRRSNSSDARSPSSHKRAATEGLKPSPSGAIGP